MYFKCLFQELAKQIEEYIAAYEPDDQQEWKLVLGEINSFIAADNTINVLDMDSNTIVLSHRLVFLMHLFLFENLKKKLFKKYF